MLKLYIVFSNIVIFAILSLLLIHEHESVFFIFFLRCLEGFFFLIPG